MSQYKNQIQQAEEKATQLKKAKVLLENQLEMEALKLEAEKKKLVLAHEALKEKVWYS